MRTGAHSTGLRPAAHTLPPLKEVDLPFYCRSQTRTWPLKQQAEGLWALAQRGQELGPRLPMRAGLQGKPDVGGCGGGGRAWEVCIATGWNGPSVTAHYPEPLLKARPSQ